MLCGSNVVNSNINVVFFKKIVFMIPTFRMVSFGVMMFSLLWYWCTLKIVLQILCTLVVHLHSFDNN